MRKNDCKGLKNVSKNHQNVVLTECSETGTENPTRPRSGRRRANVEELRSKLSYNLTACCTLEEALSRTQNNAVTIS